MSFVKFIFFVIFLLIVDSMIIAVLGLVGIGSFIATVLSYALLAAFGVDLLRIFNKVFDVVQSFMYRDVEAV